MKKIIAILLCLAVMTGLFSGCSPAHEPSAYEPTGDALEREEGLEDEETVEDENQTMSLTYYEDRSLNPIKSADYTNRVLMPLIYQGLFAVNRENEVIPLLCKSYTVTTDLLTYEFTIEPNATFSDGTPVTAADVAASLREARSSSFYSGRMRFMDSIRATEEGTVKIKLGKANENLPLLLDIPIVKKDEVDNARPLGTGPYVLGGVEGNRYLTRRANWWCKSKDLLITARRIPLLDAKSIANIRDNFEFSDVGVVCTDPGSDRYVEYRCDYELGDCETGIFVFLGINSESSVLKKKAVRQAISRGIDRNRLADTYYRGFALPASLPASPNSPYYTEALAQEYAYDPIAFADGAKSLQGKTIRLLVNKDDSLRVKVAEEIGRMLNTCGVIVEIVSKKTNAYKTALEKGEYDMYLGQPKLSPNMDLSPFFSSSGELSYGGLADVSMYNLCLQAMENQGNYYTLHQTVMGDGYLCPILFRSYAIYAARGLLTDLQPARDNLFCYSIGKTLTDAFTAKGE